MLREPAYDDKRSHGWRSAVSIRESKGLEGNPVRHGICALAQI